MPGLDRGDHGRHSSTENSQGATAVVHSHVQQREETVPFSQTANCQISTHATIPELELIT
jgi:hypothetical protein